MLGWGIEAPAATASCYGTAVEPRRGWIIGRSRVQDQGGRGRKGTGQGGAPPLAVPVRPVRRRHHEHAPRLRRPPGETHEGSLWSREGVL